MNEFLYIFGYEDPFELVANEESGSDFESSKGIWIKAESEKEALEAGQLYAENFVKTLFENDGQAYSGWRPENYANWIEHTPLLQFSGLALESLPRVDANNQRLCQPPLRGTRQG